MPDNFIRMRLGEKRPIYGQESLPSGTLTVSASPAPIITLYDDSGAIVTGFNGITATGYDTGAQTAPRVWHSLDTATLTVGHYLAVFKFTATGSDGIVRIYEPAIQVQVLAITA